MDHWKAEAKYSLPASGMRNVCVKSYHPLLGAFSKPSGHSTTTLDGLWGMMGCSSGNTPPCDDTVYTHVKLDWFRPSHIINSKPQKPCDGQPKVRGSLSTQWCVASKTPWKKTLGHLVVEEKKLFQSMFVFVG